MGDFSCADGSGMGIFEICSMLQGKICTKPGKLLSITSEILENTASQQKRPA
jgi:hypothetical protein